MRVLSMVLLNSNISIFNVINFSTSKVIYLLMTFICRAGHETFKALDDKLS